MASCPLNPPDMLLRPEFERLDLAEAVRAVALDLSPLLARLDAHINQRTVHGNRYSAQARSEVDTEEFAGD